MSTVCGTNQIDSNVTGLSFAEEECYKTLGDTPVWYGAEPNSYASFGSTLKNAARAPITATRQQKKGSVVDLDATVGFQSDLTQSNLTRLMQGFFFASLRQQVTSKPFNGTQVPVTAVTGSKEFDVAVAGFAAGHLVRAAGFASPTNNGLFSVVSNAAGVLTVNENTAAEASPPAAASLEVVGMQGASGDISMTYAGGVCQLVSASNAFAKLTLIPGQWVFIGGDAAGSAFATVKGYARVSVVTAGALTLDKTTFTPVADAGVGKTVEIFTGSVLRSEDNPANIVRRSFQFERTLGNDASGVQSQYVSGSLANKFTLNLAQGALVTADLTFVSADDEQRTGLDGLKTGTRVPAPGEAAFNTTSDVYMMRLDVEDDSNPNPQALFGFASDAKLDIDNGVQPNKAIGVLGAFDASSGNFTFSGSVTAYFTTVEATKAVRQNADAGLYMILAKQNAGVIYDAPLLSLGGGAITVTKDKPITVPLDTNGAQSKFGHTFLQQVFDYLPLLAMPQ